MTTTPATPGLTPAPLVRCVTAQNPSPMTLAGTNTYVLFADDADAAVVLDPGPAEDAEGHLERVRQAAEGRRIELVLVSHRHADHTGGIDAFHAGTGAPVRAADPSHCRGGGLPLTPDEEIVRAGVRILAWHTRIERPSSAVLPALGLFGFGVLFTDALDVFPVRIIVILGGLLALAAVVAALFGGPERAEAAEVPERTAHRFH